MLCQTFVIFTYVWVKGEEYKHFAFPLLPYILADGVVRAEAGNGVHTQDVRYKTMLALSEMIRIHYYGGRNGWSTADRAYYRRCLRFYLINREEDIKGGETYCSINAHGMHAFPDYQVSWWGEPENSSCWGRERKVKEFVAVPNNGKNFALSMAITSVVKECFDMQFDDFPRKEKLNALFKDPVSVSYIFNANKIIYL